LADAGAGVLFAWVDVGVDWEGTRADASFELKVMRVAVSFGLEDTCATLSPDLEVTRLVLSLDFRGARSLELRASAGEGAPSTLVLGAAMGAAGARWIAAAATLVRLSTARPASMGTRPDCESARLGSGCAEAAVVRPSAV
jgi:hypothetical protein